MALLTHEKVIRHSWTVDGPLHVWEAGTVIVDKRGLSSGYARTPYPLFVNDDTDMLFGTAKAEIQAGVNGYRETH